MFLKLINLRNVFNINVFNFNLTVSSMAGFAVTQILLYLFTYLLS